MTSDRGGKRLIKRAILNKGPKELATIT